MITIMLAVIFGALMVFLVGGLIFLFGGFLACLPVLGWLVAIVLLDVIVIRWILNRRKKK